MVICGYFKVKSLSEPDSKGNNAQALCENCLDADGNMEFILFLPPYLRENMCNISEGSKVFGFAEDSTGLGCAVFGENCDIGYYQKSDFNFKSNVVIDGDTTSQKGSFKTTSGNFTTTSGDVTAGTVSLKNHMHPFTGTASVTGTAVAGVVEATGPATGTTNKPV